MSRYAEGSFQQVFWQQQKDAASKTDKRGIRWHPLFIKWCLYLDHLSCKAYDALRNCGSLYLPSKRTLQDYSHCIKAGAGFSCEVDEQLLQAAKPTSCEEWQTYVVLLLDEMHIIRITSSYQCVHVIMKWLEKDFLGYLDSWEESVKARAAKDPDTYTKTELGRMLLSAETRQGLRKTGNVMQ